MSIELFSYGQDRLRTAIINNEPAFHAADVCAILDIRNSRDAISRLDDDEKGVGSADTPGGMQRAAYVTESGLYALVFTSRKPEAKAFKRWITGTVLPALRKTGTYSTAPALTGPALMAAALVEAQATLAAQNDLIEALEPKALVAEKLLDATGDYEVADAAKVLSRSGVITGRNRLFNDLEARRWIYRSKADGKWRVVQKARESGYMNALPQSHYHPKTGILILDPPQPRVTPKGIARILKDYNKSGELVLT